MVWVCWELTIFAFSETLPQPKLHNFVLCAAFPFVVDDPDTKAGFSSILIDLYNGGKYATVGKGEMKPKATVVISSNLTLIEEER